MNDQYRLGRLGNSELLAELSSLVRQSNELTAQVLAHLVELEERMLHLELGFASLFSYCVEALGMSEGAAGRRVAAARVCRRFPGAFEGVARGQLHLCALCALAPHLTADNATELMDACRGKTRRQVEELLAVRFPRPDVREQIRRLPARMAVAVSEQATPVAQVVESCAPPPESVETSPWQTLGQPPAIPANPSPTTGAVKTPASADSRWRARELEPLSADRFGVHFTADAELRDLIERARALASHRLPNGDLASLMKLMAASFVQQEEKRRFGIGARPRRNTSRTKVESTRFAIPEGGKTETVFRTKTDATLREQTAVDLRVKSSQSNQVTPPGGANRGAPHAEAPTLTLSLERLQDGSAGQLPERTRYVTADARREIHERDRGRCAFVSASGRRCNARAFMQLDHVIPFARRGANEVSNLRFLCRAHNRLHARQCFGALHLAAKIAVKRTRTPGA